MLKQWIARLMVRQIIRWRVCPQCNGADLQIRPLVCAAAPRGWGIGCDYPDCGKHTVYRQRDLASALTEKEADGD